MHRLQQEIINDLGVQPAINPDEEIERRVTNLTNYLGEFGLHGYVLGISGGQDSLLAGMLAQKAVQRRRDTGHDAQFYGLLLPYGEQADRSDAILACETIQPDVIRDFNIKASVDAFTDMYIGTTGEPLSDFAKGNVKARERMKVQYAVAGEHKLAVIGTDHGAEAVTGFFTKFGDGAADVLPLSGLNKRQGRQILQVLGVPEVFVTKQPTADLLDVRPGQTDEQELGITYDQIDDYLEGKQISEDAAAKIEIRYETTRHKRALPVNLG